MNAAEQERLYQRVRDVHFYLGTTLQWLSGYVHGVQYAETHREPDKTYQHEAHMREDYAEGFMQGFIDYHGDDALHWMPTGSTCHYRWWL